MTGQCQSHPGRHSDVVTFVRALPPDANILDLGGGNGIPIAQHLIPKGFDSVTLDRSAEMIARLQKHLAGIG